MKLENWSIVDRHNQNPDLAPECLYKFLCGECFGHPHHTDRKIVTTSIVIALQGSFKTNNLIATTKSGSVYELGTIDPKYLQWCQENNHNIENLGS